MKPIPINAENLEGFIDNFLIDRYQDSHVIAPFHREWLSDVSSPHPRVAIAAPRGHSKTTTINHAYGLAVALFQQCPLQLKISRTYKLAVERIKHAKEELTSNRRIIEYFKLKKLIKDAEDDLIAEMDNGYQFRMVAISSEQEGIRGFSWGTMRPQLVIGDDMESDDQVLSPDRREKMFLWWMNTIMPIGDKKTRFRVIGTVQHNDSLLINLLKNPAWQSRTYEGCNEDLTKFLWPDMYPRQWWQEKKAEYAGFGNIGGFNMEYRNIAIDTSSGFFRPEDFIPMAKDDEKKTLTYYVGGDFAISTKEKRDFTVFVICGLDSDGTLYMVDLRKGRWDGNEIIDEMFSIHETWAPDEWFLEDGAIRKALGAALEIRMRSDAKWLAISPMVPLKDKSSRARSIQARMRAKAVRFDHATSWFGDFQQECIEFPRGTHDDQVDALAWIGIGLARMVTPMSAEEVEHEDMLAARRQAKAHQKRDMDNITGYELWRATL